ncbi:MAG: rod shape-determining protein [Clostridia bacterium]|nr:rod shape-determining protein [Clostridia bacterium]
MAKCEVAVLDFGSSKITILVGVKGVNNTFKVIASGSCEYAGFMNGEFIEPENLSSAISYAKNQAENAYGKKIKRLYVGVPTEFCYNSIEHISMNLNNRVRIKQKHINKLFENANINYKDREIINKTPIYFVLDDSNHVLNPEGCTTSTLEVMASYISVEQDFYNFMDKIFCEVGVYTIELISLALAESLYLIGPEFRQNGAILVDCGFITTSVNAVFFEGVTDLKSFSLGGGYITSDIMEVLQIPFDSAEQLKRKMILSINPTDEDVYDVVIDHEMHTYPAKMINDISLARIDMIAEGIIKCLQSFKNKLEDDMIIYLTGGGLSFIKGIGLYLEEILNRKVVIVAPQPLQYNKPDLSSSLSLIDAAINIEQK